MRNYMTKACNFVSKVANECGQHELRCSLNEMQGAAFLQRSINSDETFLRGLFAWSIAEPNRNIHGQDMINAKRTTQRSVM